MRVVAAAAYQGLFGGELVGAFFVEEVDDAFYLGHHFGADSIAGEKEQIVGRHTRYLAGNLLRGLLKAHHRLGNLASGGRHSAIYQTRTNRDVSQSQGRNNR